MQLACKSCAAGGHVVGLAIGMEGSADHQSSRLPLAQKSGDAVEALGRWHRLQHTEGARTAGEAIAQGHPDADLTKIKGEIDASRRPLVGRRVRRGRHFPRGEAD